MRNTGDLRQAVFEAVYRSRAQRCRRATAASLIFLGQVLRTLVLVWPVGLLVMVALAAPGSVYRAYILLVLAPGLLVWGFMLVRGTHRDYHGRVRGRLLRPGELGRFVMPPRRWHED